MIYTTTRKILTACYKPALILMVLNIWLLIAFANKNTLQAHTGNIQGISILFFLQNCIFAFWLHWSKEQKYIWSQLTRSYAHQQLVLLPSFLLLSFVIQLLPIMIVIYGTQLIYSPTTILDIIGFVWIWIFAWTGYCLTLIYTWWRKWTFAAMLFLLPLVAELPHQSMTSQFVFPGFIFALTIAFIIASGLLKRLTLTLILSIGVLHFLYLIPELLGISKYQEVHTKMRTVNSTILGTYSENTNPAHLYLKSFSTRRSLVHRSFQHNLRASWPEHKISFNQPKYGEAVEPLNIDTIESKWKNLHGEQSLTIANSSIYQHIFLFKDAIYRDHADPNRVTLWTAQDGETINWFADTKHEELEDNMFFFGNSSHLYFWLGEGNEQKIFQLPLDAHPRLITLQQNSPSSVDELNLAVLTWTGLQSVYSFDGKQAPKLLEQQQLGPFAVNGLPFTKRPIMSWPMMSFDYWLYNKKQPSINWMQLLLFHLLSSVACVIYFYRDTRKELYLKTAGSLLIGLPFFLACLLTFSRKKTEGIQSRQLVLP